MKTSFSVLASVLAGLAASACCWIPALLGAGAAGTLAFVSVLASWRPYLLTITFLFLAMGFFFILKGFHECCITEEDRAAYRLKRRINLLTLLVVSVFVVGVSLYPNFLGLRARRHPVQPFSSGAEYVVRVNGMDCAGCASIISKELEKLPGVTGVEVNYEEGLARVSMNSSTVSLEDIIVKIKESGFSAEPVPELSSVLGGKK